MADPQNQSGGKFLGLGLNVAVGVALGALVGRWLDKKYGWTPNAMTIGALIGMASGMYILIKEALKANKD